MALITAAQVREHFPGIVGTGEDTLIDTMIARADGLMAAYCGFPTYDSSTILTLEDQTYTRYYDEPDIEQPAMIMLGIRPVVSVTSVYVDSSWDYTEAVAAGDLVLDGARGYLWLRPDASSSWETAPRANKIVFVAGFATTPPDLVAAAAMAVRHLMDLRGTAARSSITSQGSSQTRIDADDLLPSTVRTALAPYVIGGSRVG